MNKKGFFFTILAMLLIVVMYLVLELNVLSSEDTEFTFEKQRVSTVQQFSHQLQIATMDDMFRYATRHALRILSENVYSQQEFNYKLEELVLYGTLDGVDTMVNKSVWYQMQQYTALYQEYYNWDMTFLFHLGTFQVYHVDAFTVEITQEIGYQISTFDGTWQRLHVPVIARVSIEDLPDPLLYDMHIARNISSVDLPEAMNTQYFFNELLGQQRYVRNASAPSFLQRFVGDRTPSEHGIMSFLANDTVLIDGGVLGVHEKAYVDVMWGKDCDELIDLYEVIYEAVYEGTLVRLPRSIAIAYGISLSNLTSVDCS
ncbi:MAG: hypothetical protein ACMXYC_02915 [Candidatus Woesearchaeota archaeon]